MNPEVVKEEEVVPAKKHQPQIERAQCHGDGPLPAEVQLILDHMDAIAQRQLERDQQHEERLLEDVQRLLEDVQRRWEREQQREQRWREDEQRRWEREQQREQQRWEDEQRRWEREQQREQRLWERDQQSQERLFQMLDKLTRLLDQERERSTNIAIRTIRDKLVPVVRIEDGKYPSNFPATLEVLRSATGARINSLLQFYNLADNGTLAERKRRLEQYVGCNL